MKACMLTYEYVEKVDLIFVVLCFIISMICALKLLKLGFMRMGYL